MKLTLSGIGWYDRSRKAITRRWGEHANLFIDLLAATSPRKSVKANYKLAEAILNTHIAGGDWRGIPGMMPSHRVNVARALRGEPIKGQKVRAFADALKGDPNAAVVDVWVLRYFRLNWPSLTPKRYKSVVSKLKAGAKRHRLTVADYQAIIWTAIRRRYGFKEVAFHDCL